MRNLLDIFNSSFEGVSRRTLGLLEITSEPDLFRRPRELPRSFALFTIGEYILRSAAAVEQTFGGITRRLWDDPFEWTLPEELSGRDAIRDYFGEVRKTRADGFAFFGDDTELFRLIPAPEVLTPIIEILLTTIDRAAHFEGRAYGVAQQILPIRPDFP